MNNNGQKEDIFLEEVEKDERYSRKVHKVKALAAVVVCLAILTVINWSTIVFVADYVKELTVDVYNKEGITVFPEDYEDIFEKVSPFSSGTPTGIIVEPGQDEKTKEKSAYTAYGSAISEKGLEKAAKLKNDGEFVYAVSGKNVNIYSVEKDKPELVSVIERQDDQNFAGELFVYGDRLVLLGHKTGVNEYITAEIYDISDKTDAVLLKSFGQSGKYIASCMKKDALYLISEYGIKNAVEEKPETFVPMLIEDENSKTVGFGDVCIYSGLTNAGYVVITGIDVSGEAKIVSNKSLLGYGNSVYLTDENIYITSHRQKKTGNHLYDSTDVTRLEFDNGKVKFKASGNVPGYTYGENALTVYDGTVCVVTRMKGMVLPSETEEKTDLVPDEKLFDGGESNCVYMLDKKLGIIGKLEGFLGEEKIYSAFLIKDKLYFDIHKDVFPCINISDKDEPALLGGGFEMPSELYPYGDGIISIETENEGFTVTVFEADKKGGLDVKAKIETAFDTEGLSNVNTLLMDIDEENGLISFRKAGKFCVYSYDGKEELELVLETEAEATEDSEKTVIGKVTSEDVLYLFYGDGEFSVFGLQLSVS